MAVLTSPFGIEPRTSCTRSENHAAHAWLLFSLFVFVFLGFCCGFLCWFCVSSMDYVKVQNCSLSQPFRRWLCMLFHNSIIARTNPCNDLAKATKASDGKKSNLSRSWRKETASTQASCRKTVKAEQNTLEQTSRALRLWMEYNSMTRKDSFLVLQVEVCIL